MQTSRSQFLKMAGYLFFGHALEHLEALVNRLPVRALGKTGASLPVLGLGGWHLGMMNSEPDAIGLVDIAVRSGIKFIDTANCYQGGQSQKVIGKAIKKYKLRKDIFLMTKVHARTAKKAIQELNQSLKSLGTDNLDLWQFHDVRHYEDLTRIFAPGGALEAALQAKKQGKIRFIGLTGHYNVKVQQAALKYHEHFDTIQVPVNPVDAASSEGYANKVVPAASHLGLGVIAMKTMVKGKLVSRKAATADQCLRFALSQPVSMLVSGIDRQKYLQENLKSVQNFKAMTIEEQKNLVAKVRLKVLPSLEHYKK